MSASILNLPMILEGVPPGSWVAISETQEKVLAYGVDAQAVVDDARRLGEEHPLIVRVPEQNTAVFV